MSAPPLSGLRVLDLSHNLARPLTTMHLGDLGADVIKVERPAGDEWRFHERMPGQPDRSRHHMQTNRNTRAVGDEQTWADGLLERVEDAEVGTLTMTAPVVRLSDSPGAIRFPGRRLGADTRQVLGELGLPDAEIDALVSAGAAYCE